MKLRVIATLCFELSALVADAQAESFGVTRPKSRQSDRNSQLRLAGLPQGQPDAVPPGQPISSLDNGLRRRQWGSWGRTNDDDRDGFWDTWRSSGGKPSRSDEYSQQQAKAGSQGRQYPSGFGQALESTTTEFWSTPFKYPRQTTPPGTIRPTVITPTFITTTSPIRPTLISGAAASASGENQSGPRFGYTSGAIAPVPKSASAGNFQSMLSAYWSKAASQSAAAAATAGTPLPVGQAPEPLSCTCNDSELRPCTPGSSVCPASPY
jgi:hypothetical protein